MSRLRKLFSLVLVLCASLALPALADRIILVDGSVIEGHLVSVDENRAVIRLDDGSEERVPRGELAGIEFEERKQPEIRVRIRVRVADDLVRLYLDGAEIADPARTQTEWIELGPLLAEGANLIEAEVENQAGTWAYQWMLDAGEQKETFACGVRGKVGCRRDDMLGTELGTFPAGRVWLYLDRASGEIELQVDER